MPKNYLIMSLEVGEEGEAGQGEEREEQDEGEEREEGKQGESDVGVEEGEMSWNTHFSQKCVFLTPHFNFVQGAHFSHIYIGGRRKGEGREKGEEREEG